MWEAGLADAVEHCTVSLEGAISTGPPVYTSSDFRRSYVNAIKTGYYLARDFVA